MPLVLDSTSQMLMRQDCVNHKRLGDGQKAWGFAKRCFAAKKPCSGQSSGAAATERG